MKCVLCEKCVEHPRIRGTCIYGGPFAGIIDRNTEEGRIISDEIAERAKRENYWSTP